MSYSVTWTTQNKFNHHHERWTLVCLSCGHFRESVGIYPIVGGFDPRCKICSDDVEVHIEYSNLILTEWIE